MMQIWYFTDIKKNILHKYDIKMSGTLADLGIFPPILVINEA